MSQDLRLMSETDPGATTRELAETIERLRQGDEAARDRLINVGCDRLRAIVRKLLNRFPRLRKWEETDDVLQGAIMRLHRTLAAVKPETVRDFYRLANLNIRRELLDLTKHYKNAPLAAVGAANDSNDMARGMMDPPEDTDEPTRLAAWGEFHQKIESLPPDDRELFDLLWYQGLTQAEAADLLGVSVRTVKRRWQHARLSLYDHLKGDLPEP